jgi:hypothetical protein
MKSFLAGKSILLLSIFLFTDPLDAQTTSIQLPTADTSGNFRILSNAGTNLLRINGDCGFYVGGTSNTGTIPAAGAGRRLMWYPAKAAFRVGIITSIHWDDSYIGFGSIATGYNSIASGNYSTALGYSTEASGGYSTALGYNSTASANYSIAIGNNATANGSNSVAIGYNATSSGGIAMGSNTTASAGGSTALGNHTTASGFNATAMGISSIASGDHSTALGAYMKASKYGSFVIGDMSKTTYDSSSAQNQMTMRFDGGYRLYSNSDLSAGVYMLKGDGAWRSTCDRNKKENFCQIDGEQILIKIKEMPITEWNYKGVDPSIKYIGPVAQDFYSAFHLGGTDSLGINNLCIDGVNIAAIQALEKRTAELQKATVKIADLEKFIAEQQAELTSFNKTVDELKNQFIQLKKEITAMLEPKKLSEDSSTVVRLQNDRTDASLTTIYPHENAR